MCLFTNGNGIGDVCEGLGQGKGENTIPGTPATAYRFVGDKQYELSNHLGNVLSVVSDRKLIDKNTFMPDILSYSDYYPFGMQVPTRHGQSDSYRYGFQGQEKDDEIKGEGNSINYKYRMHDPRIGRFFAVDPLTSKYPHYTPYSFSGNKVIQFVELEGLEESGTIAGSVIMSTLFPLPPKIKNNPQRQAGAHGLNFAGKSAALAVAASPLLAGASYGIPQFGAGYEAYSSWYGTTATAKYFATGVGGTSSIASGYLYSEWTAAISQVTWSSAGVNALSNATAQYLSNGYSFGKINTISTASSIVPGMGPAVFGETFSWTPNDIISGKGPQVPESLNKWSAQAGSAILGNRFGKATDSHLSGESFGGKVVGEYFKALITTGTNSIPQEVE